MAQHPRPTKVGNSAASRLGLPETPVDPALKVGIALDALGQKPLNGFRHAPVSDTSGWYLWAGVGPTTDPGFFSPLHISHLSELLPEVLPYLSLPTGYRFLIADGYEDVWYDGTLVGEQPGL